MRFLFGDGTASLDSLIKYNLVGKSPKVIKFVGDINPSLITGQLKSCCK